MKVFTFKENGEINGNIKGLDARWCLLYSTCTSEYRNVINEIKNTYPDIDVFGATSFQGTFSPAGFQRGGSFLIGESKDEINVKAVIDAFDVNEARKRSLSLAEKIKEGLGDLPDVILMHATPGFEERIIEGINDFYGNEVPVYGGSAGDDDLTGKWKIFLNLKEVSEGLLLVGIKSRKKIYSGFLSGYLPTNKKGKVTKAEGRIIYEIDNRPAAIVYNEWTNNLISEELEKGGVILGKTTLYPIGRIIEKIAGVPFYLLSHPHMVFPDKKSLSFFTEFKEGDEVILMHGSVNALIDRTEQVASRALGLDKGKAKLYGGILIYCAGCVGAVGEKREEIIDAYKKIVGDIPFIGAATFGEQGCFRTKGGENKHGNLMCNTILFGEI
ncbi:MAG: FIST N-terminal domain-containing protein [candidate division WOR-3 bacterium]